MALIWRDRLPTSERQAARVSYGSNFAVSLWQAMSPQRTPSLTIDTDADEATLIFRRYCRWIGDTLRKLLPLMSSGVDSLQFGLRRRPKTVESGFGFSDCGCLRDSCLHG